MKKHNYVHRDIKPENIFRKTKDGIPRYLLGDFGLSAQKSKTVARMSTVGTDGYMAPETATKFRESTFLSDVYSLGITLAVLASNEKSFSPTLDKMPPIKNRPLRKLIIAMTKQQPESRIGRKKGIQEFISHPFFKGVNWEGIERSIADTIPKSHDSLWKRFCNLISRRSARIHYEQTTP